MTLEAVSTERDWRLDLPPADRSDGALVALAAPKSGAASWGAKAKRRIVAALSDAGFGPLTALFLRHPRLAMGLWLPILTLTAIGLFRGDLLATVLGLYALSVGAIFANAGAHDLLRDAPPTATPATE